MTAVPTTVRTFFTAKAWPLRSTPTDDYRIAGGTFDDRRQVSRKRNVPRVARLSLGHRTDNELTNAFAMDEFHKTMFVSAAFNSHGFELPICRTIWLLLPAK